MMRRTIGFLAALAIAGCARTDAKVGANRVTLATSTADLISQEIAADGRIAFARYVAGKSAIYVTDSDSTHAKRVSFGVWDIAPTWSPDGKQIAFIRDAGGNTDVVIVPADSGAERVVAGTSADEGGTGWLPDGSGLVFIRSGAKGYSAWLYLLADGSTSKLFEADGSVVAFPSPDGKSVAYSLTKDGKTTLWLWDRAKRTHRQLTTEGFESIGYRCFSPDSRTVLYESRRTGTPDLWRVDVETGKALQLTQDVASDGSGRWSPDGSRIAFLSDRGGQPDLWVLSTGESDVQRVTDDAIPEGAPSWTPDGSGVVVSVGHGHTHLYALSTAGGAPTTLTSGDWDVDLTIDVSRDGSKVAFASNKNGDNDVWTVPATGGEPRLVSGAPGYDGVPKWSPDGTRIAFTSVRGGNRGDIWIAPADGSGPATQLTNWPTDESNPRWSPDGKTIAFTSTKDSPGADLWTMPVAGGSAKRITGVGTVQSEYRWSPDGQSIAFAARSETAGGQVVFTVPAGGGAPRQLAPPTSWRPSWSPDSRQIAAMQCKEGYCAIEIRLLDGKVVKSFNPPTAVYENWTSWSPDGSQLLVAFQDLGKTGSYEIELRLITGESRRVLQLPAGMSVGQPEFALGDKAAITTGGPTGSAMQRIAVPGVVKP